VTQAQSEQLTRIPSLWNHPKTVVRVLAVLDPIPGSKRAKVRFMPTVS